MIASGHELTARAVTELRVPMASVRALARRSLSASTPIRHRYILLRGVHCSHGAVPVHAATAASHSTGAA